MTDHGASVPVDLDEMEREYRSGETYSEDLPLLIAEIRALRAERDEMATHVAVLELLVDGAQAQERRLRAALKMIRAALERAE